MKGSASFAEHGDVAHDSALDDNVTTELLQYRPATNADCDAVEQLVFSVLAEYELAPEPEGIDGDLRDLEGHYFRSGGWFGVWIDESGAIRGTAGLFRLDDSTCELRKMYLHRAVRGRGQGRAILERALDEARRLRFARVTLETAGVLKEALRLYEQYGFRREDHGPPCAARCDIVMSRSL